MAGRIDVVILGYALGQLMVEVYHFKVWDSYLNDWVIPLSKRTAEFIAGAKGEIISGTKQTVDPSALDEKGRYYPIGPDEENR